MNKTNVLAKTAKLVITLLLFFAFSGCVKNQLPKEIIKNNLSNAKEKEIMRFGVPELIKNDSVFYNNRTRVNGRNNATALTKGDICDPENWDYTSPIFEGFSRTLFSCNENDYVSLSFKWKIQMLGTIFTSSSHSYGKLTFTISGGPSLVVTPSLLVSTISSATYPGTGEPFTEYELTMNYTMPYYDYCGYEQVSSRFYLDVNYCTSIPGDILYVSGSSGYKPLTPNEYRVYECGASNGNPGPSFSVYPLFLTCGETPCHNPLLGFTPNYLVHYRKVGVSSWSTAIISYPYTSLISVSSTGTYEYQTRGQVDAAGNYSAWTSINTVTVF